MTESATQLVGAFPHRCQTDAGDPLTSACPVVDNSYLKGVVVHAKDDVGMRRAAVSVPSNIAEGFERHSRKEYVHFLHIAKGSLGELRSLLYVAREIGYLSDKEHSELREKARFLSGSIANQIKSISASQR
jgi:four helix bundle protein